MDAKIRGWNIQSSWRTWSSGSICVIDPGWAEGHWHEQKLDCRLGFLKADDEMEFRVFVKDWHLWKKSEGLSRLKIWMEYCFAESSWAVPSGLTQSTNVDNPQRAWPQVKWLSVTETNPEKVTASGSLLTAFPTAGQQVLPGRRIQAVYLCVDTVGIQRPRSVTELIFN